jgi:hypothetical protein
MLPVMFGSFFFFSLFSFWCWGWNPGPQSSITELYPSPFWSLNVLHSRRVAYCVTGRWQTLQKSLTEGTQVSGVAVDGDIGTLPPPLSLPLFLSLHEVGSFAPPWALAMVFCLSARSQTMESTNHTLKSETSLLSSWLSQVFCHSNRKQTRSPTFLASSFLPVLCP